MKSFIDKNLIAPRGLNINYLRNNGAGLIKKFPNFYKELLSKTSFLNDEYTITERLYYVYHDILKPLKCIECGKEFHLKKFRTDGLFCSSVCGAKSDITEQKRKNTSLEKYGETNPAKSEEVKKKILNTNQELYGVNSPMQVDEFKEKQENTCIKKYGKSYYNNRQKAKETSLERYGVTSYTQTDECKEKIRSTCLERYDVEFSFQHKEFIEKAKQTLLEKYGVPSYAQTDECHEKIYNTKKKNKTFKVSKKEDEVFDILSGVFGDVKRQYRSEAYPFNCDFYIPSLDLYIEYNGTWTHGKEPFDENNAKHTKKLEIWKQKAEEINFKNEKKRYYINAINTWTVKDVKKRNWALYNNLNWIEFFNINSIIAFTRGINE